MAEPSRLLFLAGSLPFLFLGFAHALATPQSPRDRRGLSPHDSHLAEGMSRATVRLTKRTDLWSLWVGFNLSHGLGAVAFAAAGLLVGRSEASFAAEAPVFIPFAIAVAALYVVLAARYWFRTPLVGCLISIACFVAAWASRLSAS